MQQSSIVKFIVLTVVCVAAAVTFLLSAQEDEVRGASQSAHQLLDDVIASGGTLTDEEVREKLGRDPDQVRELGKHRLVEEYSWTGNFGTYTVYAYYKTAATKLLEAVSINQAHPEWEGSAE